MWLSATSIPRATCTALMNGDGGACAAACSPPASSGSSLAPPRGEDVLDHRGTRSASTQMCIFSWFLTAIFRYFRRTAQAEHR